MPRDTFDSDRLKAALCSAALDVTSWKSAMETVVEVTRSHGALLIPLRGPLPLVSPLDCMQEVTDEYVRDGWTEADVRFRGKAKIFSHGVATDRDFVSEDEIRKSAYYQDFLGRHDLRGWAALRIGGGGNIWTLALQRRTVQGEYSDAELETLQRIVPCLEVVAEIGQALFSAQAASAMAAFETSRRAAVLLGRDGRVCFVNRSAERLLHTDICIKAGRLHCASATSNDLLSRGIRRIIWERGATSIPPILLNRREQLPIVAYVMAVPGTHPGLSSSHAIVVLVDPNENSAPSVNAIQAIHGLTHAEARLAVALARGFTLEEYALRQGVSKQTVRHQLKAIFDKTGLRRQAQLVATLAHLLDVS